MPGISVHRRLCKGECLSKGLSPGGSLFWGFLSTGVSVRREGLCPRVSKGSVPVNRCEYKHFLLRLWAANSRQGKCH